MRRVSLDRANKMGHCRLLSCQDTGSTHCLDLLLSTAREEASLHNDGLLGQNSLAENLQGERGIIILSKILRSGHYLVKSSSGTINNWSLLGLSGVLSPRKILKVRTNPS